MSCNKVSEREYNLWAMVIDSTQQFAIILRAHFDIVIRLISVDVGTGTHRCVYKIYE